jgi:hypothetical protein
MTRFRIKKKTSQVRTVLGRLLQKNHYLKP